MSRSEPGTFMTKAVERIDPSALDRAVTATSGYAFMVQLVAFQTCDEVGILDRPDSVTDPSGLEMVEDLTNALGSRRLPCVDREGNTGPTDDLECRQVSRERVAGLVSRKIECHGQILGVQRCAELCRLDALGLRVVAECAKDDRAAEAITLPGASLFENDLDHLTGTEVALYVPQGSEPRLGMQRIVGRQLGAKIPHAGSQGPARSATAPRDGPSTPGTR